jgi:hypothetical protein
MSLRQTTALLHSNQNAPKPSIKNEVYFCGPVPVYRSRAAQLDWFATFDNILKNSVGNFELPPRMLYDGPGMAQQWLRNAGQRIQHNEACDAFRQFVGSRLSDILRIWQQSTTISLVALGIGDSKKARYLLSRIFYSRPHQTIRSIWLVYFLNWALG